MWKLKISAEIQLQEPNKRKKGLKVEACVAGLHKLLNINLNTKLNKDDVSHLLMEAFFKA